MYGGRAQKRVCVKDCWVYYSLLPKRGTDLGFRQTWKGEQREKAGWKVKVKEKEIFNYGVRERMIVIIVPS